MGELLIPIRAIVGGCMVLIANAASAHARPDEPRVVVYRLGDSEAIGDKAKSEALIAECMRIFQHVGNAWQTAGAASRAALAMQNHTVIDCHLSPLQVVHFLGNEVAADRIVVTVDEARKCQDFYVSVRGKFFDLPLINEAGCGSIAEILAWNSPLLPQKENVVRSK